jgi:hypothetical protein
MKKRLVLILFGLLIVAFSAPVYAQFEWKVSGYFDTNAFWYNNVYNTPQIYGAYRDSMKSGSPSVAPNTQSLDKTGNYFNTRGRFKFDAVMGKEVSASMWFEMDSTKWGETGGGVNQSGKWQADQPDVEVKDLYLDFAVPYFGVPVPTTVRIGIQPLVARPEFAVNTDGTGITLGFKLDPVTISPYWAKASHYKDYANDDADVFGLNTITRVGKLAIGAWGVFYNMRTYPLSAVSSGTFAAGVDPSYKAKMYWFGAYADGRVGPLDMKADLVMDYGKVEGFGAATTARDVNYQGWVARLNLALPIEMFEVGTKLMYATGSDTRESDGTGFPGTTTSNGNQSRRVTSFVSPPGTETASYGVNGPGLFYDNMLTGRGVSFQGSSATQMTRNAVGGTWHAFGYASYKLFPWYKLTAAGGFIGDTTQHGNTVGTAIKANGQPRDDSDIGWELGLYNEIQIYKNLSWGTSFAYLIAGDALDWAGTTGSGQNISMSNPWVIGSIIKYTW